MSSGPQQVLYLAKYLVEPMGSFGILTSENGCHHNIAALEGCVQSQHVGRLKAKYLPTINDYVFNGCHRHKQFLDCSEATSYSSEVQESQG